MEITIKYKKLTIHRKNITPEEAIQLIKVNTIGLGDTLDK